MRYRTEPIKPRNSHRWDLLKGILGSLFFLFFLHNSGKAQGPPLDPAIKAFPPSTYKDHAQIYCAARDSPAGMWFGAYEGVFYHTGEAWEKVHTQKGMHVFAIAIDHKERIWVGGSSEFGYLRPVPASDTSGHRPGEGSPTDTSEAGAPSPPTGEMEYVSLTHLVPDSLRDFHNVWNIQVLGERVFFNANNVIFVFDGGRLKILRSKKEFHRFHMVNGALWVLDKDAGLYRLRKTRSGESLSDTAHPLERLPGSGPLAGKSITKVLDKVPGMTGKGEVLVLTRRNGLYRYRYGSSLKGGTDRITPIGAEWRPRLKKAGIYHATTLDPDANPWGAPLVISTISRGAMLLDTMGRPVHVLDQKGGMTANYVWRTVKGAPGSGMLWSTTNKGIVRWTPGDPRTFTREGKAFSGSVEDITRYRGRLFIATHQGVYVRGKRKGHGGTEWKTVPGTKGQCFDLLPSGEKGRGSSPLLIGSGKGLLTIRPRQGGPDEGEQSWKAHEFSRKHAYTLTELPSFSDKQWAAFGGRAGIILISRDEGEGWRERLQIKELPEEVISLQGGTSHNGRAVELWSCLRTKGGFRVRLDTAVLSGTLRSDSLRTIPYGQLSGDEGMALTAFTGKGKERKGLPEGQVRFFPFQDRIVAGTDSGMYRSSKGPNGTLRWTPDTTLGCFFGKCPGKRKGEVKQVFRLREVGDGSIWINSDHPYHLNPKEDGGYRIDSLPFEGMGLGTVRAFFSDSNDITWMGGDNGLVRYDEQVEKEFRRSYRCFLRKVSTTLQDTARAKKDSVLFGGFYRKPAPEDNLLGWKRVWEQPEAYVPTLPYRMNGLTFRYAAPYYESQKELTYSYRLEGFDEAWSDWKKETRKEYTNLAEGNYTFRVKAKNVYGVESKPAEYRFRILPPWYRTWTAYGGYTLAGIGFIWLLLWLNGRRLVAQKQRLERTVEERTQEIREQKEKVEEEQKETKKQKEKVEEQQKETEEQREEAEKQKQEVEQAHKKLEEVHKSLEESHREITASIDYAKKIQHAILQSEEYVSGHLPEHFVLFKPQATVSGDFYWAKEQGGHLYFAAVDCTGHGVPGAFMSMLGISQLNEIMATKELPSPGEILTDLRERVVTELRSGDPEGGAKDGMDAAIVKIPLHEGQYSNSKKVEFAGANNPLYVVKEGIGVEEDLTGIEEERINPFKESPNGFEVKGDKMAVGYEADAAEAFTTAELKAPSGAMLYLFSDGYADQFGGLKGKKFRYGPFKKLLAELHEKTVEEQKQELDRVFEEWKAESQQEQIDDVVVVGVRV